MLSVLIVIVRYTAISKLSFWILLNWIRQKQIPCSGWYEELSIQLPFQGYVYKIFNWFACRLIQYQFGFEMTLTRLWHDQSWQWHGLDMILTHLWYDFEWTRLAVQTHRPVQSSQRRPKPKLDDLFYFHFFFTFFKIANYWTNFIKLIMTNKLDE